MGWRLSEHTDDVNRR